MFIKIIDVFIEIIDVYIVNLIKLNVVAFELLLFQKKFEIDNELFVVEFC